MADLSDVCAGLVSLISGIVYPNGIGNPSVAGIGLRIYQGWPMPLQLDADLAAGLGHISVYPRPEEHNATRYLLNWRQASINTPTVNLAIVGQTVTVSGTIPLASNPHNAVVFVNSKPYVYAVLVSDTLASIATALAALIAVDVAGTVAVGAVITVPSSARLNAVRIGITGTSVREVRRQEKLFQVGIWTDTPAHRDAIAQPIDAALAGTFFLTFADGTAGRLIYKSTLMTDQLEKSKLYRRDLFYSVEYGTLQSETETQVTETKLNVSAAIAGVPPYQPVTTVYD